MAELTPVDHDPFAAGPAGAPALAGGGTPVDHDPFATGPAVPRPAPMSVAERVGTGMVDPIQGGAQLLSHAVPPAVERNVTAFNNWLSDIGVPLARLPSGGMDQQTREREARIQAETPPGAKVLGVDPARLAGNVLSPPNYIPATGGPVGRAALMGARSAALEPMTAEGGFEKGKAKQIAAGGATGAGIGATARALGGAAAPRVSADVRELLDAGVQLTPGQMAGRIPKRAEEAGKSIPITGSAIRGAEGRALDSFNLATANRALGPIGATLPPGTAGRDVVAAGQQALDNAYNAVLPGLTFQMDQRFAQDIGNLRTMAAGLPAEQRAQFDWLLRERLAGRLAPTGTMGGEVLKSVQSELSHFAREYGRSGDAAQRQLGHAVEEMNEHIRDALQRQNPQAAQRLRDIGAAYAAFVRIENAASRRPTGDGRFTPGDLLAAIKGADPTVRKRAFARGDALLQPWAETGNRVLTNRLPDSGTPERMMWDVVGGAGGAMLDPKLLAGMLGGSLPYTQMGGQAARAFAQPGPTRQAARRAIEQRGPLAAPAAASAVASPSTLPEAQPQ